MENQLYYHYDKETVDWYAMSVMIIGFVVTTITLICICILHKRKKANI